VKTVRFSRVVETAGRPHVHTLWVAPDKDAEFKRARDAHRVMTLTAAHGKTEAGVVGYEERQQSSEFLIFPKSLARFDGARVVGIKFDLVEQPKFTAARRAVPSAPQRRRGAKHKGAANIIPFRAPSAPASVPAKKPEAPPPTAKHARAKKTPKHHPAGEERLVREIRAALQELEAGKSVAAYRRLEQAIEP
jgi:hypothetical protein